jgi:hypothetical protein
MDSASAFDDKYAAALRELLEPGERLLWSGRPRLGLMLRASDAIAIPFSLFWCGFAIFWEWGVISIDRAPWFFKLWGIPFVAVGLYLVFGRFVVDAYQRGRTFYGITDQRAVILIEGLRRTVRTLALQGLTEIEFAEGRGGRGTLTFGRDALGAYRGFALRGWPGSAALAPSFEGIENASEVLRAIRKAQRALKP